MAVVHCLIHACNSGTKSSSSSTAGAAAVATDATNCYEPPSSVVYSSSRAVLVYTTTELQSDRSHSVVVDSDPGFEATNGFELLCSST